MAKIKNIMEVTNPLKEEILKGHVHTKDDMSAGLLPYCFSDSTDEATINIIERIFTMRQPIKNQAVSRLTKRVEE